MSLEREIQREEHRTIVSAKQQRRKKRINRKENDCLNKYKEIDKDRRTNLDVIKDQQWKIQLQIEIGKKKGRLFRDMINKVNEMEKVDLETREGRERKEGRESLLERDV